MVFLTITAITGFIAFFFYHRIFVLRLQHAVDLLQSDFASNISKLDARVKGLQLDQIKLQQRILMTQASSIPVKKTNKRKPGPGRPINPNSVRQRKMRGEK